MAEVIDLRGDSPHEDAPAAKRARALTDKNHGVDGADSALPKSPIARRAERSATTAPAAPADAAPVPPPADAAPVLAPPTVPPGTRVAVRYDDEDYEGTVADALDEHRAMVKFDDGSEHPINFTEPGIRITREAPAVAPAPAPVAPPPAAAPPRGECVPCEKVRELEEGLKRATFRDKDVAGTSENREAVEALFEGSDLSDFLGRGKDLITPAGRAEPITKRDLPRSPVPTQGSPVPRDSAKRSAARQKT